MDITKKKVLPKGALVIILHTCEFPEGNTWAKRSPSRPSTCWGRRTKSAPSTSQGSAWIFELTPVSEYDERWSARSTPPTPGDMPAFQPTMQAGLDGLKKSDAATKHMIIISDGDPAPPTPQLLKDFTTPKIRVSTVSIYPHGGMEIDALRAIANVDRRALLLHRRSRTAALDLHQRSQVPQTDHGPEQDLHARNWLSVAHSQGIGGLPPLHGYVITTPKERLNELILQAHRPKRKQLDPVLARWKFGLGTTAAFTSDLSTNWGADWVGWENYRAFVKQLMIDISRVQEEEHLRMWSYTSGTQG